MTSPSYPRKLVATVSLATVAFVGISPLLTPTFTVAQAAEDITPITSIQGIGDSSPLGGQTVTTRGQVTAVFAEGGLKGYTIQTEGADTTPGASDGLFVYSPDTASSVKIGETVEVTGKISEYNGQTQITVAKDKLRSLGQSESRITPVSGILPETDAEREALESMLLQPTGDITVTDNYNVNRYGEIKLANGVQPLRTATDVVAPGIEAKAYEATNAEKDFILDDGATVDYTRGGKDTPLPYLSSANTVRVGSAATFTQPTVLLFSFGEWRLNPTQPVSGATDPAHLPASFTNTRTDSPEQVGGDFTIASFNVLNYFSTTGDQLTGCTFYTDREKNPITVNSGCDARGAANAENLKRQQDKIVAAINTMNTSVLSLEEIENSAAFGKNRDEALATLVAALNTHAGYERWSAVASPKNLPASEDVIRTAFIYQKDQVQPQGESEILLDTPAFDNARKPLAQVFEPAGSQVAGDEFVAIVNHFKSKGSGTGENADQGDGQGASNADRVQQAQALVAFADEQKSQHKTENVVLLGDFNAYSKEDPIKVLTDAGYINVGEQYDAGYSYVYGGRQGSLDHVLVSPSMNQQVTGADVWNINSVESIAFEYSRFNNNITNFYSPDAYRSSDHDPKIVGFNLKTSEPASFIDVKQGDPFYTEIMGLANAGVIRGWADGTFRPTENISRGAVAAFFYRLAGSPDYTAPTVSRFKDVPATHSFYQEISWLADQGITTGWADGTFRPEASIQRDAMAAFFYRYAGSPTYVAPRIPDFTDVKPQTAFYQEISWLYATGIATGWDDGTYRPNQAIQRAPMAAFIYRYETKAAGKKF